MEDANIYGSVVRGYVFLRKFERFLLVTAGRSGVDQYGYFCMGVYSSVPGSGQTCFDDSTSLYIFIRVGGLKSHEYRLLTRSENAEMTI